MELFEKEVSLLNNIKEDNWMDDFKGKFGSYLYHLECKMKFVQEYDLCSL